MLDKNTDSILTFIIDKNLKEEFSEYCKNNDVTKSKVLRDTVRTWLDYVRERDLELTVK